MKRLITIMIACSLAVVVHVKVGQNIKADRIHRYLNNGVIVEIDSTNVQNRMAKTRVFVPNYNINKIVETD